MKFDLSKKITLLSFLQLTLVTAVLSGLYYQDAKEKILQQYVEKSRSIVLTAEATMIEMGKKWDLGIYNAEILKKWSDEGLGQSIDRGDHENINC